MNNLQNLKAQEKELNSLKTDKARFEGQREALLSGLFKDHNIETLEEAKELKIMLDDELVELEESYDAQDLLVEELINTIKGNKND